MATALNLPTLAPGPTSDEARGYGLRLRMAYLLAVILTLALIAVRNPPLVKFRELSLEDVVGTLAALAIISAFLERAVEVFVAAWRVGEQQQLEIKLQRLRADRAGSAEVKALRLQLNQFRHETRMYSLAVSVVLGILVSLAGVRALAAVVESGQIEQGYWHNGFFNVLDVLITGALLSGGADAIHKVVSTFTTFMEATKSRVKGAA
jgi:hypothetical protein